MTVWTISSQPGSGGEQIARLLSERAGVPLVDPRTMLDARGTVDRSTRIRRVADWLSEASASAGSMLVAPTNILPPRCEVPDYQELTDLIVLEAARSPAVILDWSAFAVLRDHPAAYHVRIRAPLKWRARLYARENCLPQEVSEQALSRLERERRSSLQRRKGEVPDAPENFALVCDASRIPSPDLVELLLVAGRRTTSPVSVFVDPAQTLAARALSWVLTVHDPTRRPLFRSDLLPQLPALRSGTAAVRRIVVSRSAMSPSFELGDLVDDGREEGGPEGPPSSS